MAERIRTLSIVIPVLNEAENISSLIKKISNVFIGFPEISYEIIFVNDGSTDNSCDLIKSIAIKNPRVKLIDFSRNFGNQSAIIAGLKYAAGDAVITMDADFQHPVEVIEELIEKWKLGAEVVLTKRLGYRSGLFRKLFFWGFSKFSDIEIEEAISDFRLLDRKVVNSLNGLSEKERFFRGIVHWVGFKREFIHFEVADRQGGQSKFSYKNLFLLAFDGFTSFSTLPLKLSWYLGLTIFLGSSFSLVIMAVTVTFFNSNYFRPIAFVSVLNALLSGLILICLGFAAKYLELVYRASMNRPSYIIRDTFNVEKESLAIHQHHHTNQTI